jgi:hypothetical protein
MQYVGHGRSLRRQESTWSLFLRGRKKSLFKGILEKSPELWWMLASGY